MIASYREVSELTIKYFVYDHCSVAQKLLKSDIRRIVIISAFSKTH